MSILAFSVWIEIVEVCSINVFADEMISYFLKKSDLLCLDVSSKDSTNLASFSHNYLHIIATYVLTILCNSTSRIIESSKIGATESQRKNIEDLLSVCSGGSLDCYDKESKVNTHTEEDLYTIDSVVTTAESFLSVGEQRKLKRLLFDVTGSNSGKTKIALRCFICFLLSVGVHFIYLFIYIFIIIIIFFLHNLDHTEICLYIFFLSFLFVVNKYLNVCVCVCV